MINEAFRSKTKKRFDISSVFIQKIEQYYMAARRDEIFLHV